MKNVIRFFAIVALSAAVSMGVAYAIADTLSGFAAISIFGGLFCALVMGAFRESGKASRYESIKHRSGRNYGQAAIMLGTVCLYMGSPQDCEELCDDLWHRGVQAEWSMLTGEEEFEIL